MMDGVATLRILRTGNDELTALVPASRIFAGVAPIGTAVPSIALESVSQVDLNMPNPGETRHVTERVQATVADDRVIVGSQLDPTKLHLNLGSKMPPIVMREVS